MNPKKIRFFADKPGRIKAYKNKSQAPEDECPKNIDSGVAKNLKKPSQNKKKTKLLENVPLDRSSTSTTPIVEKIDKIERLIFDGKITLVDDKGKPLDKVDSLSDHDSKDEVESVDNEIASFLASKMVGFGQEISDKIQSICDNLEIKVQGQMWDSPSSFVLNCYLENNASSSGKKKQVAVSSKKVSNSNPFDELIWVENDDELVTNGGNSKSAGKGPNSSVSPSNHGFFDVASSTFGKHLEEIHMTWTQFGKKRDKNATLQNFDHA
ncbi:hypothetical protein Tco_0017168 [Tanacetum coccineum]